MLAELLPLATEISDVQAGGGGGFGGGGGGGGGGDGDGIFWIVYWLVRLAIEYPPLGVPLLIGFVVVAVVGTRKGWWKHQERTIRRSSGRRRARASHASAELLRRSDPAFDEARFLARVGRAFERAQASWCAQDLEPLRAFVTDGVFERFSLQIEEQRQDGWRQQMPGLRVHPPTIVHVAAGQHFDTVTVRIPFQADILRVDRETGEERPGTRLPRRAFTECWSFLRRRGTKSVSGEGLMEGMCPNCGATLAMNQSARCGHCECLVRSGRFDWVLAEITQASEWRPEVVAGLPGLAALLERDPGFDVQVLEDRASVAFWRKVAADRAGRVDALTRVAREELCRSYAARLAPGEAGERTYLSDCAVGSVRTLGILAGPERERAVVEVVWDGRPARVRAGGERRLEQQRRLQRTLFVFERAAGASTRLDEAFTTATCRTCGAHDAGGTTPDCPWCGAPRSGDASTWLVAGIHERGTPAARALLGELRDVESAPAAPVHATPSPESAAGLLTWAAALVRADGEVDEKELRAVHSIAERIEVPAERVDELLFASDDGSGPATDDPREARAWFQSLTELSLADGSLSRAERGFLQHAAQRLGLGYRDAERAIRSARTRLYAESRAARTRPAAPA